MMLTRKYFAIVLFMVCHTWAFAQFNTLAPKRIGSEVITQQNKYDQIKTSFKNEKKKNRMFKMMSTSLTKKDLKQEIDSLKAMLSRYERLSLKERNLNSTSDLDSLQIMKDEQSREPGKPLKVKPMKKYELLDDVVLRTKISMPLEREMVITSPFGMRKHPIFGISRMHTGTDLKANYENVYAVLDGVVTASGWDSGGGGNYIKIRHSDSFETSYLHLSERYYDAGESVKAGFIIAKSGNTGNSTGAHLHFSVTEHGKYINPIRFLNDLIKANNLIATNYESEQ